MDAPQHPERRLVELAKGRFGVASIDEARQSGLTYRQIERRLHTGFFRLGAPGALIIGAAPPTWEQDVAVAVIGSGPNAVASHLTAAALWGMLRTSGGRVEVTVDRWDRTHRAYTVHESLDLAPCDTTLLHGIRITNPARTTVDAGAVFPSAVPEMFQRAKRLGLVAIDDVAEVVHRVGRKGRSGVGPARELVRNERRHPDQTESWAEDIYLAVGRQAGLPEPIQQYEIRDMGGWFICRCDFAYPPARLAVFIDGYAYHSDLETFQKDRDQTNRLGLIDWRSLRFTYRDLTERPEHVVYQVRSVLS